MKTSVLRAKFLQFFEAQQHHTVPSDSLIPAEDPTLLFSGAGMNQFKDYFLGLKSDIRRATSVQKCIRTGDLDNVGRTPYHHSFFEMLGNFSFGDYFKREAINWAWQFLTGELNIPPDRLRVSVYKDDDEAFGIWEKDIGLSGKDIATLDAESNFWPSDVIKNGPNGPCGPCSEIYFDQGRDAGCRREICSVECDCGRFAEIWNLVFTQFDRQSDGSLAPLAAKNIDTGMGLERLACVLQGKRSNYEIDLFDPIFEAIRSRMPRQKDAHLGDMRAVADHLRAITFAIGDGAYPSNEGRGYVIRKLIRRALWRSRKLSMKLPVLHALVPSVRAAMADAYPELAEHEPFVTEVVRNEEDRFLKTLEKGLELIEHASRFTSADVFRLYDTYGFPVELTSQIAEERGLPFEVDDFNRLMDEQRQRAKESSKISAHIFSVDTLKEELLKRKLKPTVFVGYDRFELDKTEIVFLVDGEGRPASLLKRGSSGLMVTRETPFYAEGGGQVGDQGEYRGHASDAFGEVEDTFKKEHFIFHRVRTQSGALRVGDAVRLAVDKERRLRTMYNHTATHLLHAALRKVLGGHVRQLGSVVEARRLRFDFSHFQALAEDEKKKIEELVNEEIKRATAVEKSEKTMSEAKEEGALAFFGEKYGSKVRVVSIGSFSKELCGGTHVENLRDIGRLRITSESSVGSGVRRIEAVTSTGVAEYEQAEKARRLEREKREKVRKTAQASEAELAARTLAKIDQAALIEGAREINGIRVIVHYTKALDKKGLGTLADTLKKKAGNGLVAVFSEREDKLHMIVTVSAECPTSSIRADGLVKKLSALVDGRGGGRHDFAQGGGKIPQDREAFMQDAAMIIEKAAQ